MREIKFRAWHKTRFGWITGFNMFGFSNYPGGCKHLQRFGNDYHESSVIIEQFTGLIDKNGKEIYEGDIIVSGGDGRNFKIAQHKSSYCLYVAKGNHVGWLDEQPLDEIKVIGNIHEHSDLLKGEQQ